MDTTVVTYRYRRPASGFTGIAQLFGILSIILMLVWLLHYRGSIEYDSNDPARVFNVRNLYVITSFRTNISEN